MNDLIPLKRSFYEKSPDILAKDLLGKLLVRNQFNELLIGRIVEVEAYLPNIDPAAHSYIGETLRNKSAFGPAGHAYVHMIHGNSCLDIVAESNGIPGSVLIRALEPISGIEKMKQNRGSDDLMKLTTGPGKLCSSFAITRELDGIDITKDDSQISIAFDNYFVEPKSIGISERIGISKAKEMQLRFYVEGNKYLSR